MIQGSKVESVTNEATGEAAEILACEPVALPPELAARTEVLPVLCDSLLERGLEAARLGRFARHMRMVRRAWALFREARNFGAVVTLGDLEDLVFAALQRLRGRKRSVHVMYDCLWYGGGWLRRAWMRFCLRTVDCCVVWASVECDRYARAYGVPREKFLYVPHHHTMHHYRVDVRDLGFVFAGGNADRDYGLFFEAVRDLNVPCVLATNRPQVLAGLDVPSNVQVQSLTPVEFRQRMAEARIVVMPMRATLLHAGAQQSVLNAMLLGKPVILTDPEGGADYIENGKTGVLVPYGDVAALQEAIRSLWEHPDEGHAVGERARLAAAPMTVVRCNTTIWTHVLRLVDARRQEVEPRGRRGAEPEEAKTASSKSEI